MNGITVDRAVRARASATGVERATFGMLTSFSVTVAVSRVVNYVRERRRPAPLLRSWTRRAFHAPGRERARVHHFAPGLGLALASGAVGIFAHDGGLESGLSVPFGVGLGLTVDEMPLLLQLDNPYWGKETLAVIEAAVAALGGAATAARVLRRA
jgi:hypothetical protein